MKLWFLVTLLILSHVADALPLQIDNLPYGWLAHDIPAKDPAAAFFGGAEAIINLHEGKDAPETTIRIYATAHVPGTRYQDSTAPWRNTLFTAQGLKSVKIFQERTYQVDGHWRYVVEYSLNNGTSLRSMAMVAETNGELHTFFFELPESHYIRLAAQVRELFRKLSLN